MCDNMQYSVEPFLIINRAEENGESWIEDGGAIYASGRSIYSESGKGACRTIGERLIGEDQSAGEKARLHIIYIYLLFNTRISQTNRGGRGRSIGMLDSRPCFDVSCYACSIMHTLSKVHMPAVYINAREVAPSSYTPLLSW